MLKRVVHTRVVSLVLPLVTLIPAVILTSGCAEGDDDGSSTFGTFSTTQATTSNNDDMTDEAEADTSDSMGDGDGDPTTAGDGDGDPTTTGDGDGDPTTTGDGDGDPTTTGDGDGDPVPNCGNGMIDPGETCDGNDFGGVSCVDLGYDGGVLSCNACAVSPSTCTNSPQPGLGQLYSNCLLPENCPGLDGCATVTMDGDVDPFDGYCTNFCVTDAECSANTGGSAVPQCNDAPDPYCELDCSGGKTCPGGMECVPLQGGKELCY